MKTEDLYEAILRLKEASEVGSRNSNLRIDVLSRDVANLNTQLDKRFDGAYSHVDARFSEVYERFGQIDERFCQLGERFEQMDVRFEVSM
jgi:hypothetical protein